MKGLSMLKACIEGPRGAFQLNELSACITRADRRASGAGGRGERRGKR